MTWKVVRAPGPLIVARQLVYHAEDPTQRAALLAALGLLARGRAPAVYTSLNGVIVSNGHVLQLVNPGEALVFLRLANPSTALESLFWRDDDADPTCDPNVDEELTPGAAMIWAVPPAAGVKISAATAGHLFRATKAIAA